MTVQLRLLTKSRTDRRNTRRVSSYRKVTCLHTFSARRWQIQTERGYLSFPERMLLLTKTPRHQPWTQRLKDLANQGLERRLRCIEPLSSTTGLYNGQPIMMACSNDYLGIAQHPKLMASAKGGGERKLAVDQWSSPSTSAARRSTRRLARSPALFFPLDFRPI